MTHRIGPDGCTERYQRPVAVAETADRVRRWAASPEACQSCSQGAARRLLDGMPLCATCRAEREPSVWRRQTRALAGLDESDRVELRGLAVVFDQPSEDMGFREFIRPGALDRTVAEGIDIRALWSHNPDLTIGRMSAGTLDAHVVAQGLEVRIDPPSWAAGYLESVKRRDVTGMSFGFRVVSDEWRIEDEQPIRDVLDMRVFEVSGVSFPAYPATTLEVARADQRTRWQREANDRARLRLARVS